MSSTNHHLDGPAIERKLAIAGDDRRRLAILEKHIPELCGADPARAIEMAAGGLRLATIMHDGAAMATMARYRGQALYAMADYGAALEDLRFAFEYYAENPQCAAVALDIARAHTGLGEYQQAVNWYGVALEWSERGDDLRGKATALEMLAELCLNVGDYTRALEQYLQSLAIYEQLDDADAAGVILSSIGILYGRTGDYDAAHHYFTKSLEAFQRSNNKYHEVKALMNLGNILFLRGDLDTALQTALTTLAIYQALGDRVNVGHVLVMIGNIHERNGRLDMALEFQRRAYTLVDQSGDNEMRVSVLLNIARLNAAAGALDDTLFVLGQALPITEALDEPRLLHEVHELFADAYERQGSPVQALEHYKRFARLRNDIAGKEKQKALAELQVRFDIEKSEREREIYRLKAESLEAEMRLKQNELAAMALNLVGKKELLDSMKEQLEQLGSGSDHTKDVSIKKLVRDIEGTQHSDNDWKRFEQQLDNLHQDFVRILSERYPSLTPTELKICSLTRINLQTKDIANLLFTSVRTIHAHKYNIRKKLLLASSANLTTFLAGLS